MKRFLSSVAATTIALGTFYAGTVAFASSRKNIGQSTINVCSSDTGIIGIT